MKSIVSTFLTCLLLFSSPALAEKPFTLADYNDLQKRDTATAELVLKAMRETVFYAQDSVGAAVICASPVPITGKDIAHMFKSEIADPTNMKNRSYTDNDPVAFVLTHALKKQNVCK